MEEFWRQGDTERALGETPPNHAALQLPTLSLHLEVPTSAAVLDSWVFEYQRSLVVRAHGAAQRWPPFIDCTRPP